MDSPSDVLSILSANLHSSNDQWIDILRGIRQTLPTFFDRMINLYQERSSTNTAGVDLGKKIWLDGYGVTGFFTLRQRFYLIVRETDPLHVQAIADYLEVYNDLESSNVITTTAPLLVFHALSIAAGLKGMDYRCPQYRDYIVSALDDTLEVLIRKNGDYSSAYRRHGLRGLNARLYDKLSRMINLLTKKDKTPSYEPTLDSALDLAGYSLILLGMTIEDDTCRNHFGRQVGLVDYTHGVEKYMKRLDSEMLFVTNFKPVVELQ